MSFFELARRRFSVRQFEARKVEQEKLDIILEAGRIAPTAANRQPQRILVVQSEEGLEKASRAARIHGAPLLLIVCADRNLAWRRAADGSDSVYIDASIVTDHMMLAATDLGLGSLWICGFRPDALRQEFDIPEHLVPVNILAIGYNAGPVASPDRHAEKRLPREQTVFYEEFPRG
ncbi:MAG: nitroreductase family protein [Bacillota bacterium]